MAKKLTTRDKILDAAFELTRKQGVEVLSVRAIAKKCNCSTQPIYISFKSIEEIKDEIYNMAMSYLYTYILSEIAKKEFPEFKALGMSYVKFAYEESELFRYIFMTKPRLKYGSIEASFEKSLEIIKRNLNLSEAAARKLHTIMWVFGHGIATMHVTDYLDFNMEQVSEMYSDVFAGIIKILGGANDNRN